MMGRGRDMTAEQRRTLSMRQAGVAVNRVALQMNISQITVSMVCVVETLRERLGRYCAYMSTSVKFDTEVDQGILFSFFEGAKAGAHWRRHIS